MLNKLKLGSTISILLAVTIIFLCFGKFIPIEIYRFLYGISLSIKSIIIFLLPIIIFGLLFRTTINLAQDATFIIGLILVLVCCSSFIVLFLSYFIGNWIYNFNLSILLPCNNNGLEPSWFLKLPQLISNDKAMIAGIILGLIINFNNNRLKFNKFIAKKLDIIISIILKSFTYLNKK